MRYAQRPLSFSVTKLAVAPLAAAALGGLGPFAPRAAADAPAGPVTGPAEVSARDTAPREAAPRELDAKVLVLPFQPVDAGSGAGWVGRSIQQSLVTDLTTSGPLPVASSGAAPAD